MAALALIVGLSILFFWIHGDSRTHTISETSDAGSGSETEISESSVTDDQSEVSDDGSDIITGMKPKRQNYLLI